MKKWTATAGVLAMAAMLAACSGEEAANNAEAEGTGAGISGSLDFYTSQPDADAQALVNAFTEKNPGVEVSIFRSGIEEVVSKIQAEDQAGDIQADVLLVADSVTFENFKKEELLLPYKSPETEAIDEAYVDPDGTYTGTKVMATGLIVNTNEVKDLPDSWSVLTEKSGERQSGDAKPVVFRSSRLQLGRGHEAGQHGLGIL
nr:extracellular solute-binding protein [Planococcus glaciei]